MKRYLKLVFIMIVMCLVGCGNTNSEQEYTTKCDMETYETQLTTDAIIEEKEFLFGELQSFDKVSKVFKDEDIEYAEQISKYKNDYATAEVKLITKDYSADINCAISYRSILGAVDNIQLRIDTGNDGIPGATFYETDINHDGTKDLVVLYSGCVGTEGRYGIYVYDFVGKQEIEVLQDNVSFTKSQEKSILSEFQKWYVSGESDVIYLNCEDLFYLHPGLFTPEPIVYNGEPAIHITFAPVMRKRWITLCRHEVILVYRNGEYVVDKVWSSGKWAKENN